MWEVEFTDEFEQWWLSLTGAQQEVLDDRVMLLAEIGPGLRRPTVGDIKASRHANMKELRASKGGALRVLFAFDPLRNAILLLGGDKSGQWKEWYWPKKASSTMTVEPRKDPSHAVDQELQGAP